MKNLLLLLVLILPLVFAKAEPSRETTQSEVEEEAKRGEEEDPCKIPLTEGALTFPTEASCDSLNTGNDSADLNTGSGGGARGAVVNLQEQVNRGAVQKHLEMFQQMRKMREDLLKETEYATRYATEDTASGFDVVHQLTALDEMIHGPKHKKAEPAFAKAGSTSLNSAPHAPSQLGDPCQSGGGNSAGLGVEALGALYSDSCSGTSYAEIMDCTKEAIKRINAESKGASCNSTQVMQPTVEPDKSKLQNVSQAESNSIDMPSCPTTPPESTTVMADITQLVGADRAAMQQRSLVSGGTTTAIAALPSVNQFAQKTALPWYGKALAWIFPSTNATRGSASTQRAEAYATGGGRDIANQNFAKVLGDLSTHADMEGAQSWANKSNTMMEDFNKMAQASLQENTKIQEHFKQISELNMKSF